MPSVQVPYVVFRYRGIMNWSRIYRTSMQFFKERRFEFHETRYKDKTNEFEGDWKATMKVDAYTEVVFEIMFHAMDMLPATVTENGHKLPAYNGKLEVVIKGVLDYNYDEKTPAGKIELFKDKHGKESWLHKVYLKITERDRNEDMEDFITDLADRFHEHLKTVCNVEARR